MKKILLSDATIIDSTSKWNGKKVDILIEDNVIKEISTSKLKIEDAENLVLENLHISQGFTDLRANGGEPGFEWKENLSTLSNAASIGGYTRVFLSPETNPVLDNASQIESILSRSKSLEVDFIPCSSITKSGQGKELSEMFDNFSAGSTVFFDGKKSISNSQLLSIAMQYAHDFGGKIFHFAMDKNFHSTSGVNEGINASKSGMKGFPAISEEIIVSRDIHLSKYNNIPIHIAGISSKGSVELIKNAKQQGILVTCDVHINNLYFEDSRISDFDTNFKLLPPLRTENDRQALLEGIADDTIDAIASDHSPQNVELKKVEFDIAEFGMISIENTFSMALTCLEKVCSLDKIIEKLSTGPSLVTNQKINSIDVGALANLCLFNPSGIYFPGKKPYKSLSNNTIFKGDKSLKGLVYKTIFK